MLLFPTPQEVQTINSRRLSKQQKKRISERHQRRIERLCAPHPDDENGGLSPQVGRVITRHSHNLIVADESGEFYLCHSRKNIGHAVCGDQVVWHQTEAAHGVVTAIMERGSQLARPDYSGREKPLAANITQLVIVIAPAPEISEYLLDQYLVTARTIGVTAVIALNKIDLLCAKDRKTLKQRLAHYPAIGYPLLEVSARTSTGLDELHQYLADETNILVGLSGVGKSSLIKALLPDQKVQIGRLSKAGFGRHTTSCTVCYDLAKGDGHLIDSPGVRSFRLLPLTREQLERGFQEFLPLIGQCQFNNCHHNKEPGCAIKGAVAEGRIHANRLHNFQHMTKTLTSPE